MGIPSFTAESALAGSEVPYRAAAGPTGSADQVVTPQFVHCHHIHHQVYECCDSWTGRCWTYDLSDIPR